VFHLDGVSTIKQRYSGSFRAVCIRSVQKAFFFKKNKKGKFWRGKSSIPEAKCRRMPEKAESTAEPRSTGEDRDAESA
jgi:hypothetical protein